MGNRHFILVLLLGCVLGAQAQTGGPVQPDFTGSPVAPGAHVDEFTGDFSFGLPLLTVPGPHGSSFPISLSYRTGPRSAELASWVGLGWSLNPGAVVRHVNGYPDDVKATMTRYNAVPAMQTVTGSQSFGLEVLSNEYHKYSGGVGWQGTYRYNNRKGYSLATSFNAQAKGLAALGYSMRDGTEYPSEDHSGFSFNLDPGALSNLAEEFGLASSEDPWVKAGSALGAAGVNLLTHNFEPYPRATGLSEMDGTIQNYSSGVTASWPWFLSGVNYGRSGSYVEMRNTSPQSLTYFGYLYSRDAITRDAYSALPNDSFPTGTDGLMDYRHDRSMSYRDGDLYLPIPFSNADDFLVTGTGPNGSFRLHSRIAGQFFPRTVDNDFTITQAGVDATVGGRWGVGANLGIGSKSLDASGWIEGPGQFMREFPHPTPLNDSFFVRYSGDPGGMVSFASDDKAVRADVDDIELPSSVYSSLNQGDRSGRSLYVDFHTFSEKSVKTDQDVPYKSYNRDPLSTSFVADGPSGLSDRIGEFAVFDGNGNRYVYGLPVFARNEREMRYGISPDDNDEVEHELFIRKSLDADLASTVVGEKRDAAYATSYLLTEITTSDYVDLGYDGPTTDDLGGYTKFNYRRTAGADDKRERGLRSGRDIWWYTWRVPYDGLFFKRGDLSDGTDNLAGYSGGERENYYLESVETKTHIAIFVTNMMSRTFGERFIRGSWNVRRDGLPALNPANYSERIIAGSSSSGLPVINFVQNLERLERIELYVKDSIGNPDSLLSTVFLDYSYELRHNMPNSFQTEGDPENDGVLTLKKVWMQSQRIANAKIHPYVFSYTNRTSAAYPASVRAKYPDVAYFSDSLSADEQNPDYSMYDMDRWGYYRSDGIERQETLNHWVAQNPDSAGFDPAAWQLKSVHLPTGADLEIQYEQDEYAYVQDRPAMAMVSLLEAQAGEGAFGQSADGDDTNKYYINIGDLGIDRTNRQDVFKLRSLIRKTFIRDSTVRPSKIYFKLLYALKGDTASIVNPELTSEYINGYAKVLDVGIDSLVGSPTKYGLWLKIGGEGKYTTPRRVCHDFVRTQKRGILDPANRIPIGDGAISQIWRVIGNSGLTRFTAVDHCRDIDYPNSYLRIPVLRPKKGGGLRVKRLITLDPGMQGDTAAYGVEYLYDQYDEERHEWFGSGVAANEPATGSEENALYAFGAWTTKPAFKNRMVFGDDLEAFQEPLAPSMLPGASVGYSRVVKRNLHVGRTNPGFSVSEFLTARDFPYDRPYDESGRSVNSTEIATDAFQLALKPKYILLGDSSSFGFGVETIFDNIDATQGYRFVINSMHGLMRSSRTYGGVYNDPESWSMSSSVENEYYEPGEPIPLLDSVGEAVRYGNPGKEMEVIMESARVDDITVDVSLEGDITINSFIPFEIQPSTGSLRGSYLENKLLTHVTSKVVRYPAIPKRSRTYMDGAYGTSEYVAFDPANGSALISRSYDNHHGLDLQYTGPNHMGTYHSYSFPAHHVYPELGQMATNARMFVSPGNGLTVTLATNSGANYLKLATDGSASLCDVTRRLTPGDLINVTRISPPAERGFYHVTGVHGDSVALDPVSTDYSTATAGGSPSTVLFEVISSGRKNKSGAALGGIVTYGETPEDVLDGSMTEVVSSQYADRRSLAQLLTTKLAALGGNIVLADISSLDLEFINPSNSQCDTLTGRIRVEVSSGSIQVKRQALPSTTTTSSSTLYRSGGLGWFDVDRAGRIVYRCGDTLCPEQIVSCLTFCPDQEYLHESMPGVIAASAITVDDPGYLPSDLGASLGDRNDYEAGLRGRWRPESSFAYSTSVIGGAATSGSEVSYNSSGVYDDFTLFNWLYPIANDSATWIGSGKITRYSPHGHALENEDPLGVKSAVKFTRDFHTPLLSAANADYTSVAFESFEDSTSGRAGVPGVAHAGRRSMPVAPSDTVGPLDLRMRMSPEMPTEGVFVRFWGRGIGDVGDLKLKLSPNTIPAAPPTSPTKVVQTGAWTLYEVVLTDFDGASNGDPLKLTVTNLGGDSIWIDDVRVQPLEAEVTCYVFDSITYRPVAVFDRDHFGAYMQYNAQGTPVRTILETARGIRTVADGYTHVPGSPRTGEPGGGDRAYPGRGGSPSYSSLSGSSATAGTPSLLDNTFDIAKLEVGPRGADMTVFGRSINEISGGEPIDLGIFDRLVGRVGDMAGFVRELDSLDLMTDSLRTLNSDSLSVAGQKELRKGLRGVQKRRMELLRAAGIGENEWNSIRDEVRERYIVPSTEPKARPEADRVRSSEEGAR